MHGIINNILMGQVIPQQAKSIPEQKSLLDILLFPHGVDE